MPINQPLHAGWPLHLTLLPVGVEDAGCGWWLSLLQARPTLVQVMATLPVLETRSEELLYPVRSATRRSSGNMGTGDLHTLVWHPTLQQDIVQVGTHGL